MDISDFFAKFLAVANVVGNIASVLGFITLLATITGYFITHRRDPFGDRQAAKPRYQRFFQSFVDKVRGRDRSLLPPAAIGGRNSCVFTNVQGIKYVAHFPEDGTFRVLVSFNGGDAQRRYETLENHKTELEQQLHLVRGWWRWKKPDGRLAWKHQDGSPNYIVAIYYPQLITIGEDAKKLKEIRKWAVRRLLALKSNVDAFATGVAAQSATPRPSEVQAIARYGS